MMIDGQMDIVLFRTRCSVAVLFNVRVIHIRCLLGRKLRFCANHQLAVEDVVSDKVFIDADINIVDLNAVEVQALESQGQMMVAALQSHWTA